MHKSRSHWPARSFVAVAAAAMAVFLVACTAAAPPPLTAPTSGVGQPQLGGTTQGQSTLQEIIRRGTLRVGTQYSFPNWGFFDQERKPAGFDIDMANAMAKALNVKLELTETANNNRIPFLQSRRVDVVISVFSITAERAAAVAFSRPYGALLSVMVARRGSGILGPQDVAGKSVAVTKGTGSASLMKAAAPQAQYLEFESPADTLLALKQGKAVAAAEGLDGVNAFVKDNPDFVIVGEPLKPYFLVAVGMRQDDTDLLQWTNTWLLVGENDGTTEALYKKWFGVVRPPLAK